MGILFGTIGAGEECLCWDGMGAGTVGEHGPISGRLGFQAQSDCSSLGFRDTFLLIVTTWGESLFRSNHLVIRFHGLGSIMNHDRGVC